MANLEKLSGLPAGPGRDRKISQGLAPAFGPVTGTIVCGGIRRVPRQVSLQPPVHRDGGKESHARHHPERSSSRTGPARAHLRPREISFPQRGHGHGIRRAGDRARDDARRGHGRFASRNEQRRGGAFENGPRPWRVAHDQKCAQDCAERGRQGMVPGADRRGGMDGRHEGLSFRSFVDLTSTDSTTETDARRCAVGSPGMVFVQHRSARILAARRALHRHAGRTP